jgi:hypothetical protein
MNGNSQALEFAVSDGQMDGQLSLHWLRDCDGPLN